MLPGLKSCILFATLSTLVVATESPAPAELVKRQNSTNHYPASIETACGNSTSTFTLAAKACCDAGAGGNSSVLPSVLDPAFTLYNPAHGGDGTRCDFYSDDAAFANLSTCILDAVPNGCLYTVGLDPTNRSISTSSPGCNNLSYYPSGPFVCNADGSLSQKTTSGVPTSFAVSLSMLLVTGAGVLLMV